MAANRLLSDEELKEMGRRRLDALTEAIDAGDPARAKDHAERMYREFLAMHDALIGWLTGTLSFIGERYGDAALLEAEKEGCRTWLEPLTKLFAEADVRHRAVMLGKILRGHFMPMTVEEDDEKLTFTMEPCGSGGRLIQAGKYELPGGFLKVANAQPMTCGRPDFPVYCTHHYLEELIPREMVGYPLFTCEPADALGEGLCHIYLYKDPKAAPLRWTK
ncbi:MAG: hypothetical protein HY670_02815 [Chloroflexi bacterium]|nr:hypothetical protein [Chloroflexota bacterium]